MKNQPSGRKGCRHCGEQGLLEVPEEGGPKVAKHRVGVWGAAAGDTTRKVRGVYLLQSLQGRDEE